MKATRRVRRHVRAFMPLVQVAALIEWTGTGLFLAVSTVYFVKIVGLSAAAVGTGLAIAGAVAMATGPLVARSTGRYGPRRVLAGMNLARALATYAFLWIDNWRSFLCVSVVVAITEQSTPPLIQAYVGDRTPQDLRVRVMAVQRTIVNVGISLGGLIAGATLGAGNRASFHWLLIGGAAAYAAVALMLLLTRGDSNARPATRGIAPLMKDRKLLGFSLFNAVMSLWTPMLNVAFPLWLVTRTAIPERVVGILYAVNTVACVALQYPMSRYTRSSRSAWLSYSAAGLLLVIACLGFAAAPALSTPAALAVFTGGILVLTFAEILQMSASWTLSFDMAPGQVRGAYLVLFGMGRTMGNRVAGPLLMTGVVLTLGVAGWISLAALFALSAAVPLAVLSAQRNSRPATAEPLPQPTHRGDDASAFQPCGRRAAGHLPPYLPFAERRSLSPGPARTGKMSSMRVLVLGGTRHVGRAVVEVALARGDDVTTVNRGLSRPPADGVRPLVADRLDPEALRAALGAREWDVVVDTWSGAPFVVRDACALLAGRAARYAYVSSRSVYRHPVPPGAGEDAPLVDGDPGGVDGVDYAAAKRGGELAALAAFGDRALLARAGLILGPYEVVGRLPWWLRRLERGGRVLAPGDPGRPLQYIDARDLARWLLDAAGGGVGGVFNTVGRSGFATMGGLLAEAARVTGSAAELVWVAEKVIADAGISPWTELPIWLPRGLEFDGMHDGDTSAVFAAGLVCRPLRETVADTWAWLLAEGDPEPGVVRHGLAAGKEKRVLDALI